MRQGLPELGGSTRHDDGGGNPHPGEGHIRALVTVAGNPVLSMPNGARLARALASLDFMVSVDIYVNETTRHAHLCFPPPRRSSRALRHRLPPLAVRNTAKYSEPVSRPPDARDDWDILNGLTCSRGATTRLG